MGNENCCKSDQDRLELQKKYFPAQRTYTVVLENDKEEQKKHQEEILLFKHNLQQQFDFYQSILQNPQIANLIEQFNLKEIEIPPEILSHYLTLKFIQNNGQINQQGERHGRGVSVFNNGNLFDGVYSQNKQIFGRFYNVEKEEVLEGFFEKNQLHGNGFLFNKSSKYKGKFLHGFKHGIGYEVYANMDKYKGEFKDDKKEGKGQLNFSNGNVYNGFFSEDQITGYGELKMDNCTYTGWFVEGKFHGKGELSYQDGTKFTGHFSDDKKNGEGVWLDANGNSFDEYWLNGVLHNVQN